MESLQLGSGFRKLSFFYKLFESEHLNYLFKLIPLRSPNYITRNIHNIPLLKTRHTFFKNSFFPLTIIEWNKLDHNIRNSSSFNIFRKRILKFIRPSANSLFDCHNPKGIKFITRLRLGLSHLREHKFKHYFQDSLNPFCSCDLVIESTAHFLLHCPMYITERHTLLSTIKNIVNNLLHLCEPLLIRTLLFDSNSFDTNANTNVLSVTIDLIFLLKHLMKRFFNESRKASNKIQISIFCICCSS